MSEAGPGGHGVSHAASQRLDKWLWCARFFKSRSLANKMLSGGRMRLSGKVVSKAHQVVRADDVLTFPQGPHIRVIKVLFLANRRGPAPEAELLYEDLSPIEANSRKSKADGDAMPENLSREPGAGRPTKRDRRITDRLQGRDNLD